MAQTSADWASRVGNCIRINNILRYASAFRGPITRRATAPSRTMSSGTERERNGGRRPIGRSMNDARYVHTICGRACVLLVGISETLGGLTRRGPIAFVACCSLYGVGSSVCLLCNFHRCVHTCGRIPRCRDELFLDLRTRWRRWVGSTIESTVAPEWASPLYSDRSLPLVIISGSFQVGVRNRNAASV